MSRFISLCWLAYRSPRRFADGLGAAPAPQWGLYAVLLRGALVSGLEYLPLILLGRVPPLRSYLGFIKTENYYAALLWIAPLLFLAHWLFASSLTHVVLRLLRRRSDIDLLLNLSGLLTLMVGLVLVAYDWIWITAGVGNQWFMGISHLVIDCWGIAIGVIAFKRLLDVPVWLGLAFNLVGVITWLPLAFMFMRSPL